MWLVGSFLTLQPAPQAALVTSIVAAVMSLIMAFLNLRLQRRLEATKMDQQRSLEERKAELQKEMETRKSELQRELEEFKADLIESAAVRNARRSYEYDARKRMYTECEPIFFHLSEAADLALRKCRDLSSPKVWNELRPKRDNVGSHASVWMLNDSSELISTMYALFAPIAIYILLRAKLTTADCT